MAKIIEITLDNMDIINVTVSDGVFTSGGGGTFINGFLVNKGTGNSGGTIEVGDYIIGWLDEVWVAGKVLTIPVTDVSDLSNAVQGEIF